MVGSIEGVGVLVYRNQHRVVLAVVDGDKRAGSRTRWPPENRTERSLGDEAEILKCLENLMLGGEGRATGSNHHTLRWDVGAP